MTTAVRTLVDDDGQMSELGPTFGSDGLELAEQSGARMRGHISTDARGLLP